MTLKELVEGISKLKNWGSDPTSFDVPQAGGRRQRVSVGEFKDDAQPMVRFTTLIGPADRLEATRLRSALELNFRLPHGCLAVEGGNLVMTDTRVLQTATIQTAATVVEFLARQADQYEKLIFKTDVH